MIVLFFLLPLQSTLGQTNADEKLEKIDQVFISVKDDCEKGSKTTEPPSGFGYSLDKQAREAAEKLDQLLNQDFRDACQEGMAWLKIECDINYDQSMLCRENMPNLKAFLVGRNMDDRDSKYFHDKYEKRLVN